MVVRAAMSGFGAPAPPAGSSAAAGARNGSSDSLEKIDMSLGEGERLGLATVGEGVAGGRGLNQALGLGRRGGTNQTTSPGAGGTSGGRREAACAESGRADAGPYHSHSAPRGGRRGWLRGPPSPSWRGRVARPNCVPGTSGAAKGLVPAGCCP